MPIAASVCRASTQGSHGSNEILYGGPRIASPVPLAEHRFRFHSVCLGFEDEGLGLEVQDRSIPP
jgi:hypothetical protein